MRHRSIAQCVREAQEPSASCWLSELDLTAGSASAAPHLSTWRFSRRAQGAQPGRWTNNWRSSVFCSSAVRTLPSRTLPVARRALGRETSASWRRSAPPINGRFVRRDGLRRKPEREAAPPNRAMKRAGSAAAEGRGNKRCYMKHGAIETEPGSPWAIWHDLGTLAAGLPKPSDALMTGLHEKPRSWFHQLWRVAPYARQAG